MSGDNFIKIFSTKTHSYKATFIKLVARDDLIGVFVKIGGKDFNDCMTISYKYKNNIAIDASLPWISSEPECSIHYLVNNLKNDTVQMIKSSLQYVNSVIPNITVFKFDDMSCLDILYLNNDDNEDFHYMSNIDCNTIFNKNELPPRKIHLPFSLSHYSIALYGQTWYERQFNAKMIDSTQYIKYKESLKILYKTKIPFNEFIIMNQITDNDYTILKPIYDSTDSWITFFNAIPKKDRCILLHSWLYSFINKLIGNTFIPSGWYIDINDMAKVNIYSGNIHNKKGGGISVKKRIQFKNDWFASKPLYH